jgi:hypothetical protein
MTYLSMWVVYQHPKDFPKHIVVREFRLLFPAGDVQPAMMAGLYDTVEDVMQDYDGRGLTWLPRYDEDDPVIAGVWV